MTRRRAQLGAGVAALAVVAAACGNGGGSSEGASPADAVDAAASDEEELFVLPTSVVGEPVEQANATPGQFDEEVQSGLQAILERRIDPTVFPADMPAAVDPDEILAGGPPPDGIPPIEDPPFAPASEIDFLHDTEPVQVIEVNGDVRAYPLQIMTFHEIVNDTIGGEPVTVTYCPLCNSGLAYNRQVGDRLLDFGTSGMLRNSALVMYDRQTQTLWDHFTGSGIVGELTGTELEVLPMQTVGWDTFRDENPDALVLTRNTGFPDQEQRYGTNPYIDHDNPDGAPHPAFRGAVDDSLALMQRVATVRPEDLPEGLGNGAEPIAVIQNEELIERGVVELEMGDAGLTLWAAPGGGSGLDEFVIGSGRDVGQTGVFVPEVDGRELTFERDGEAFVDNETGSRWNIFGRAVDGELSGSELQPIQHLNTFWFAWAAFQPDTQLVEP